MDGEPLQRQRSRKTRSAVLIAIEGPDGIGKTSLARALVSAFKEAGHRASYLAFPGARQRTIGQFVYRVHHKPGTAGFYRLKPAALQTLHVVAHLDAIERDIAPRLRGGRAVILDRYWWSTWVYGRQSGLKPEFLQGLRVIEEQAWGSIRPTLVVLLDRPRPWGRFRESAGWNRLRLGYQALAWRERRQVQILRLRHVGTIAEATAKILSYLRLGSAKRRKSLRRGS